MDKTNFEYGNKKEWWIVFQKYENGYFHMGFHKIIIEYLSKLVSQ